MGLTMSISALNTGLSGLKAFGSALDSTGFNVANANTNGFQPQLAQFQESPQGGVIVNLSREGRLASSSNNVDASPAQTSNTNLETETINAMQYKIGFQLSAKLVQTADDILATLIDLKR